MQQINRLWELKKANRKKLLPVSECWFIWDNNFASPSLGGSHWNKHLICKQESVLKENEEIVGGLDMYLFVFCASVLHER